MESPTGELGCAELGVTSVLNASSATAAVGELLMLEGTAQLAGDTDAARSCHTAVMLPFGIPFTTCLVER